MAFPRIPNLAAMAQRSAIATQPRDWAMLLMAVTLAWVALGPLIGAAAAVVAPLLLLGSGLRANAPAAVLAPAGRDGVTGLALRGAAIARLDACLSVATTEGRHPAAVVIQIDDAHEFAERHGHTAYESMLATSAARIAGALRDTDLSVRLEGARFAVAVAPSRRTDIETLIQMSSRLLAALSEPLSIDATTGYVTASAGFCLARRAPDPGGEALLVAAEAAADEAARCGPSAIKSYTVEFEQAQSRKAALRNEIEEAFDKGEIVAHFQPQISTDTGAVTAFEVLARWNHPERGIVMPGEFLPAVHDAGLSTRLADCMLQLSLAALQSWDRAGYAVPSVAINFSKDELGDPGLVDKLKWELDRRDFAPSRLIVEILESVVTDTDADIVVRNVAALAKLGCLIDLDDFGTGHASIASMRRFAVDRIKIDRSFVTRVDCDQKQRQMLAAVLSMAERLEIKTLAEGVETIGEHAILSQLGCDYVQGYAIARPMTLDDTIGWLDRHRAKLAATPGLGRRAG